MTTLTMKEKKRLEVIQRVFRGELTVAKSALVLRVSERQCYRIKAWLTRRGAREVVHGNRGRPSKSKAKEKTLKRIVELAKGKYRGFIDHHLTEKLMEHEGIELSREKVRRTLRACVLTYEFYVGPLTPKEKDRYCAEGSGIEPLLGIPNGYLPRSLVELQKYMDAMFSSGEITVTETAQALAREVVYPPIPRVAEPLLWLMRLPTIGMLPPRIREAYGFQWDSRRQSALHLSAHMVRRLLRVTPSILRHWPGARAALRQHC